VHQSEECDSVEVGAPLAGQLRASIFVGVQEWAKINFKYQQVNQREIESFSQQLVIMLHDLHEQLSKFLQPYLVAKPIEGKPLTILTWAQSLDAKIAPETRTPIALSSMETKYMTHLLRRRTDAILIGAQTAVADNPSLNGEANM
jgi:hypothetical protein